MRIAIAGNTGHVQYVLDAMQADPTLSVAAICPGVQGEPIADLISTMDRMGQWPQVFETAEEMLVTPGLDIVVAAAPFYRNEEIATLALRRSLAVFCEKPLALSLEGLERLKQAQVQAGRPICPMMGLRGEPHFAAAKRAMLEGAVGDTLLVTAQKSYKMGERPAFYRRRETYGGTIPWVGIHAIDWIAWMTGKRFVDVTARHTTLHNRENGDMETAAGMVFTLEGGAMATVNIDLLRPRLAFTHGDDRLRVAGDKGIIEVRSGHVYHLPEEGFQSELPLSPAPGIFEQFAASLRGECESPVSTQEGFYSTAAALIARESADRGETVSFAEFGW